MRWQAPGGKRSWIILGWVLGKFLFLGPGEALPLAEMWKSP